MNIILLTPSLSSAGGAEVYNRKLYEFLERQGHIIDIVTNDKTVINHTTTRTCQVRRFTFKNLPLLWRITPVLRYAWYVLQGQMLPVRTPDLIIGSSDPISFTLARRFPRAHFIFLPHHLTIASELATVQYASRWQHATTFWLSSRLECKILKRADYTVRFSRYAAEKMNNEYQGRVNPRFLYLPQAVALPEQWRNSPPENKVRLLVVGRLVKSKNCRFILDTLSKLQEYDWTLNIVGDGPQRDELTNHAKNLGMAERVHFAGHSNNTQRFYQESDLLLFASKQENQPLVVLEAMSQGTPVLAIQRHEPEYVNALDEVITHQQDGYLAKSESDFIRQLSDILREPLSYIGTTMRENARKTVADKHSDAKVLELFHEKLLQLTQAKSTYHPDRFQALAVTS